MSQATLLPTHGPIDCNRCYSGETVSWNHTSRRLGKGQPAPWRIECNPCAWGATNPRYLVLGFSKGPNQAISGNNFDEIAFKGMRKNLSDILQSLGLLAPQESIGAHINQRDPDWAFGSLIRCSMARWDEKKGDYLKSGGGIVCKAAQDPDSYQIAANCVERFLGELPQRLQVVVLLGNDDPYVENCKRLVCRHHSDLKPVNDMAYFAGNVLWVHTVHAKAQGRHVPDWLRGAPGTKQGEKGNKARNALHEQIIQNQVPRSLNHRKPLPGREKREIHLTLTPEQPDLQDRTTAVQTTSLLSGGDDFGGTLPLTFHMEKRFDGRWIAMVSPQIKRQRFPGSDDNQFVWVPVARDGSIFTPHLERAGKYTVGQKDQALQVLGFDTALQRLRSMATAKWRRPSRTSRSWGIVSSVGWVCILTRSLAGYF